jgi:CheY-like chemotaxis protein
MARILLADDDASTRDLVRRALEGEGHKVLVTQDGNEALDQLKEGGQFDLLVTDVEMPMMDGIALAEHSFPLQPGIRVLLMSGFSDQLDRAKDINGPHVGVISKPFTLEQVRETVRKLMT